MHGIVERLMTRLAQLMALVGGMALIALVLLTVVSVTGRSLVFAGLAPVPGDFELLEAGTAFAVFAFLPWCHLQRGHATVDVLARFFPPALNRCLAVGADTLMLALALLLCRQHWLGTLDKFHYGETSFILQFPLWWAYAAALPGACLFVLTGVWCLWRNFAPQPELPRGRA